MSFCHGRKTGALFGMAVLIGVAGGTASADVRCKLLETRDLQDPAAAAKALKYKVDCGGGDVGWAMAATPALSNSGGFIVFGESSVTLFSQSDMLGASVVAVSTGLPSERGGSQQPPKGGGEKPSNNHDNTVCPAAGKPSVAEVTPAVFGPGCQGASTNYVLYPTVCPKKPWVVCQIKPDQKELPSIEKCRELAASDDSIEVVPAQGPAKNQKHVIGKGRVVSYVPGKLNLLTLNLAAPSTPACQAREQGPVNLCLAKFAVEKFNEADKTFSPVEGPEGPEARALCQAPQGACPAVSLCANDKTVNIKGALPAPPAPKPAIEIAKPAKASSEPKPESGKAE